MNPQEKTEKIADLALDLGRANTRIRHLEAVVDRFQVMAANPLTERHVRAAILRALAGDE